MKNQVLVKKIHLILSVYLTDTALTPLGFYGKNISSTQNKVDQFISTIHSISKIEFNSADIYFDCDDSYKKFTPLIEKFIQLKIPQAKIHTFRMEYFKDWQKSARNIPDEADLVLLKTNHDHVFIPPIEDEFRIFANSVSAFEGNWIGEISHWPESLGNLRNGKWEKTLDNKVYTFNSLANHTIGTCLIPKKFYKSWWESDFTEGKRIVRPDNPFGPWVHFPATKRIVPNMEFFRHLDGYGHAKVNAPIASAIRSCCKINSNQIIHEDWTTGHFIINSGKFELPISPSYLNLNSTKIGLDVILLASAYKVNFKNIYYIILSFRFKRKLLIVLPSLFLNKYFMRKFLNLFLPIYSGNIALFKVRMMVVDTYKKLNNKYPNLPPNIRSIFKFKDK